MRFYPSVRIGPVRVSPRRMSVRTPVGYISTGGRSRHRRSTSRHAVRQLRPAPRWSVFVVITVFVFLFVLAAVAILS